jgi:Putative peptidoglycan binding domain
VSPIGVAEPEKVTNHFGSAIVGAVTPVGPLVALWPRTEAAIRDYQQQYGLPVDGRPLVSRHDWLARQGRRGQTSPGVAPGHYSGGLVFRWFPNSTEDRPSVPEM